MPKPDIRPVQDGSSIAPASTLEIRLNCDPCIKAHFDPLFAVATTFRGDTRPFNMDLGLGVYRSEAGNTPVLDVVKRAETQLAQQAA